MRLIDFDDPEHNDLVAVNQFTVIEGKHNRRPDVVVFVNGLPLAVIELKNAADEDATIWTAFNQLQTYKQQIPSLFAYNEVLVISDGLDARVGSLTADKEWFMPWRTIEGEELAPATMLELEVLINGRLREAPVPRLPAHFIVFEEDDERPGRQEDRRLSPVPRRAGRPSRRPSPPPGPRATTAAASSGTRRGRARASRWCSTPGASSCTRRWRTRRSSS